MEFGVIDANVVLSNIAECNVDDDNKNGDNLDGLIAKFENVEYLDLSCSKILHITNLSLISSCNLTSLKLSVNRIDTISNLESFTNLVELDLSHNHIKRIENLQGMIKLRRLILNHNPLRSVQNLDAQQNSLEMFDVGYCEIDDLKFTTYLKQFPNLVSLTVEGNPFRTEPADSERTFVVSILQSLLVYNNKTVTTEEKREALKTYSKLITVVEKNDQKRKRLLEDVRSQSVRIANRCDAFVDHIPEGDKDADFNVTVFRNRTVEQVLADNSRYGFHNAYRVYADNFRRLTGEITAAAETCRETRVRLVSEFHSKLQRLIGDGVEQSRKCVSKYIEYKNLLKCDDSFGGVKTTSKKVVKEFNNRTRTVWLTLMSHEDILSQEITKMIGELRDVFEKYMTEFKQLVDNRFIILQRQQSIFLQFILEYAVSSAQSDDIHNRSHKVSQITNDISECMESQALQVNHAGCYIIKRASKWLTDLFKNLKNEEIQRNRRKMLEIATFVHYQEESFKKILF